MKAKTKSEVMQAEFAIMLTESYIKGCQQSLVKARERKDYAEVDKQISLLNSAMHDLDEWKNKL